MDRIDIMTLALIAAIADFSESMDDIINDCIDDCDLDEDFCDDVDESFYDPYLGCDFFDCGCEDW